MRRNRTVLVVFLLLAALLCVCLLNACKAEFKAIVPEKVERITLWTHRIQEYELSDEESAQLIELYNASEFKGDEKNGDSTPNNGVEVYFKNGTVMRILDFHLKGTDFEVYLINADGKTTDRYYISSDELHTFVSELADSVSKADN